MKDFTNGVLGNPTPGFAEVREDELFWVGNELGFQSRFVEHIGQQMGKMYEKLDYGVPSGGLPIWDPREGQQCGHGESPRFCNHQGR